MSAGSLTRYKYCVMFLCFNQHTNVGYLYRPLFHLGKKPRKREKRGNAVRSSSIHIKVAQFLLLLQTRTYSTRIKPAASSQPC